MTYIPTFANNDIPVYICVVNCGRFDAACIRSWFVNVVINVSGPLEQDMLLGGVVVEPVGKSMVISHDGVRHREMRTSDPH